MRLSMYKEEYCQMLIDHMSEGFSFESFVFVVSCCRSALEYWTKEHAEFLEAKQIGLKKGLVFFEKVLSE